jgi:hypothetical protein
MKKGTPTEQNLPLLNLNVNKDDPNLNDFIWCWQQFGSRPNRIILYNSYISKDFSDIILPLAIEKNTYTEVIPSEEERIINDKVIVKIDEGIFISYVTIDRLNDGSAINEVCFYYKSDDNSKEINDIIEKLDSCLIGFESESQSHFRLNTLSISNGVLEIEAVSPIEDLDFDHFLSSKTQKSVSKLIKKIKKSSKGISVIWGPRGTGKTTIIHYLAEKLDRQVIYLPTNMVEHTINNPEFRKFFKKLSKPVIVIDDCDLICGEPFGRGTQFVGNILQLVDGLLSDVNEANLITIFNCEKESDIDDLLLDSNNLHGVINFSLLTSDEATDLSHHLGNKKKFSNPTRMIDVIKNNTLERNPNLGF